MTTVRGVLKDQVVTTEVEGGFRRRPAEFDAVYIETDTATHLIDVEVMRAAVAEVDEARRRAGKGPRP